MTHLDEPTEDLGWAQVRHAPADAALAVLLESRRPGELDEAELVDALAAQQRLVNAAEGRLLALMDELDSRREAEGRRDCREGRDITSRAQVVTEVVAATRQPKGRVQALLATADTLNERLPRTLDLLQRGRIGGYAARVIAEAVDSLVDGSIADEVEQRILAEATADNAGPTADLDVVAATSSEIRTIATRAVAEAEPGEHEARHCRAFAERRVTCLGDHAVGDGMGSLTLHYDALTTHLIYHRLGLAARNAAAADDPRTLSQQVADLAAAILTGRVEPVTTTTSELEGGAAPKIVPTGSGASAQVHVTMTLASLAGYSDAPGRLLDGTAVPASVARRIALQPGSTWYRLLTDEAGRMLDLSDSGYRPGAALTRAVTALHQRCVQIGCTRPADTSELDHEIPWPDGPTAQTNLSPKCRRHHVGKTTGRFNSAKAADGVITWTYPTEHTYTKAPPRHPVDRWQSDWQQPESLTHIQHGLAALRRETDRDTRQRVTEVRRRIAEHQLAGWYAQAPPDPDDRDAPDPDHPQPTYDEYATLRPALVEALG